jgi:hypothetical protein
MIRVSFGGFLLEQALSTAGAMLLAVIVVIAVAFLMAIVTKNNSGGDFGDHMVEQRVFVLFNEPYFVGAVLSGLILGALSRRWSQSCAAAWVWILPAVVLIWNVFTWKNGGSAPYWSDVWNNYFSSHCNGSECLYEFFVTAPFLTSLAYTVGWIVKGCLGQHSLLKNRPI